MQSVMKAIMGRLINPVIVKHIVLITVSFAGLLAPMSEEV